MAKHQQNTNSFQGPMFARQGFVCFKDNKEATRLREKFGEKPEECFMIDRVETADMASGHPQLLHIILSSGETKALSGKHFLPY